jgi:hypothetical protein
MTDGWNRQQLSVASYLLATAACATQIDAPIETAEVYGAGGVGGTAAATGGTLGATTGVGGTVGDTSVGGTSVGGTGVGGTSVGGTGVGGTSVGGTGGDTSVGGMSVGGTSVGGGGKGATAGRSSRGGDTAGMTGMGAAGRAGVGAGDGSGMGCAKLSVPMNGASDKAHFVVSLRSAADLSAAGTTISLRAYVEAGMGGVILAYAQDSSFNFLGPATKPLLAEQDGWVTLAWDIGAEPAAQTGIMKRSISRIGVEIKAAPSATWSNPTVVYVDSISVDTPALSFPFATTGTVSATAQSSDVAGQVLWLNSGTSDTTATGAKLSWVATCP